MTTVTMRNRCDWCREMATLQLTYRSQSDHKTLSCDACYGHRGLLTQLLARLGGQVTTVTGTLATF